MNKPKEAPAIAKWFESEADVFNKSIVALLGCLGAFLAMKSDSPAVVFVVDHLGKPFDLHISTYLFLFCLFLLLQHHVLELKLKIFYEYLWTGMTKFEKSRELFLEIIYLYLLYFVCASVAHFYIFLITFCVFLAVNIYYDIFYYLKRKEMPRNSDKFPKPGLFMSWIILSAVCILAAISGYIAIEVYKTEYIFTAAIVITFFFVIHLADMFINREFYLHYYEE